MLNKEEIHSVWADERSPWSPWVKPVLFAFIDYELPIASSSSTNVDLNWVQTLPEKTGLVVDLPGTESVEVGLELARRGYRPIPLYNALPFPLVSDKVTRRAVDVVSILSSLRAATGVLKTLEIPDDAPPAFLLDANRRTAESKLSVGDFDNRSMCFTTDFPSARLIAEKGIQTMVVVENASEPDTDLQRVLVQWQDGGVAILRKDIANPNPPQTLRITPLRWWRWFWYWITVRAGLRRSSLGGFGAIIEPSGG